MTRNFSITPSPLECAHKALVATCQYLQSIVAATGGGESGFVEITLNKLVAKATQILEWKFDPSHLTPKSGQITKEQFNAVAAQSEAQCEELATLAQRVIPLLSEEAAALRRKPARQSDDPDACNTDELAEQYDQAAMMAIYETDLDGLITAFISLQIARVTAEVITAVQP